MRNIQQSSFAKVTFELYQSISSLMAHNAITLSIQNLFFKLSMIWLDYSLHTLKVIIANQIVTASSTFSYFSLCITIPHQSV